MIFLAAPNEPFNRTVPVDAAGDTAGDTSNPTGTQPAQINRQSEDLEFSDASDLSDATPDQDAANPTESTTETNGHSTNGPSTSGHSNNGTWTNGQPTNGQPTNGQSTNGHPTNVSDLINQLDLDMSREPAGSSTRLAFRLESVRRFFYENQERSTEDFTLSTGSTIVKFYFKVAARRKTKGAKFLGISLCCSAERRNVLVTMRSTLVSQNFQQENKLQRGYFKFDDRNKEQGFSFFMSYDDLKNSAFLVKDQLFLDLYCRLDSVSSCEQKTGH